MMKEKSKILLILGLVLILMSNLLLKDSRLSDLSKGLVTGAGFGFLILSIYLRGKTSLQKL